GTERAKRNDRLCREGTGDLESMSGISPLKAKTRVRIPLEPPAHRVPLSAPAVCERRVAAPSERGRRTLRARNIQSYQCPTYCFRSVVRVVAMPWQFQRHPQCSTRARVAKPVTPPTSWDDETQPREACGTESAWTLAGLARRLGPAAVAGFR